jgi:primary-amine oxidase
MLAEISSGRLLQSKSRLRLKLLRIIRQKANANSRFLEAEHSGRPGISPPRVIYTNFYFKNSSNFHEALMDITSGKVMWQRNLGSKVHGPGTPEEMERMHHVAMRSELVQKEIKRLQLIEGTEVVCEPWPYGKDGVNDDERLFQVNFPHALADSSATSSSRQWIRTKGILR